MEENSLDQTPHEHHKTKRRNPSFVLLPLLGIGIAITVFLVSQNTGFRSKAAETTPIESENGTLSGPVVVETDTTASGGKSIKFTAPTTSFQPTAPYYATFFYMWYKNPNTDTSWSYWTDLGNNPPTKWFSHYIPDSNPSVFDPATELYSTNNYTNFKWQASKLAEAKQEVAIGSWWGQGTKEDIALKNILNDFMNRSDNPYPNLRWAMYYEQEAFNNYPVSQLVNDLTYIKNTFAQSPYFLKVNNKPVLFVYAGATDAGSTNPCTDTTDVSMTHRWYQANSQMGNYFYIVLKVYSGYATDPCQPNSWHQYAPAARGSTHAPHSAYASPGFWLDDGSAPRLLRNITEFQTAVTNMVNANVTWKLTETWNEWGEGTSVEPGVQTMLDSTGKEVQDPNGTQFGNTYVDILKNSLPALEQGTGGL
jgi:hypothetical protein